MKYFSYLLALLMLTSCATVPGNQGGTEAVERKQNGTRTVIIETAPPNRKIMINDEYVGDSPVTVKLAVFESKYEDMKIKTHYMIEAYPILGDAQGQTKYVELVECDECGGVKPFRIFMDMSLRYSRPNEVDVHIKK